MCVCVCVCVCVGFEKLKGKEREISRSDLSAAPQAVAIKMGNTLFPSVVLPKLTGSWILHT